jgi:hypothetical protein
VCRPVNSSDQFSAGSCHATVKELFGKVYSLGPCQDVMSRTVSCWSESARE